MLPVRLSREIIYQSKWVNLYADKVRFLDGSIIEKYHVVSFDNGAVGVVVENDKDEILLIESYRYIPQSIGWEIPAGGMDDNESILDTAVREVHEETGYSIANCQHIYSYNPSNGSSDQVFHVVQAKAVNCVGKFDTNEVKSIKWFSKIEIREMIHRREIVDGFSLTGLLVYLCK
ncbi:MAG: NUDIX hydrolase [Candidatus Edwardsbacteria bacterium]|nr:NUDIX hydrolase [Candidatus Edwardsbacteria bacterium]